MLQHDARHLMTKSSEEYERLLAATESELNARNEELMAQQEELIAAIEELIDKNNFLEEAMHELKTRNTEIGQIVYSTYHDLKSPITSIKGLLNLISVESGHEKIVQYVSIAEATMGKMENILALMTDYSYNITEKINYNSIDFEAIPDSIHQVMEELDSYEPDTIRYDIRQSSLFYSDWNRILKLLFHILSNAIVFRATNRKLSIRIKILCRQKDCIINIEDNGIGIGAEALPYVFNMFYRASELSQGAGLGLYLAKSIVQKLKGKIGIDSRLGSGTLVKIKIPNHELK